jgi:hypothetical protein
MRVLVVNLSDVVGGNHDIAEALAPREKERNVPAFNRVMTVIVGISAVDGVATPVPYLCRSASVSRGFDCQLEVVPVDVDLT